MRHTRKTRSRSAKPVTRSMDVILARPSPDDFIGLLRAWRFWLLGGLLGALIAAAAYSAAPPPFRARATVNVDFHLEQAWPENTDREQFYYLERETRKLLEIALSDATLEGVAREVPGATVQELRSAALHLSQPGNGGWHFYADDRDSAKATLLAGSWARAFADEVGQQVEAAPEGGLEPFITVDVVQAGSAAPERALSMGTYMLVGAGVMLAAAALGVLLIRSRK